MRCCARRCGRGSPRVPSSCHRGNRVAVHVRSSSNRKHTTVREGSGRRPILKVSIRQIKAARALLGWSQEDLATSSGVSVPTIKRLEAAEGDIGGRAETGDALLAALEKTGVEFIPENGGAGVRIRRGSVEPSNARDGERFVGKGEDTQSETPESDQLKQNPLISRDG